MSVVTLKDLDKQTSEAIVQYKRGLLDGEEFRAIAKKFDEAAEKFGLFEIRNELRELYEKRCEARASGDQELELELDALYNQVHRQYHQILAIEV